MDDHHRDRATAMIASGRVSSDFEALTHAIIYAGDQIRRAEDRAKRDRDKGYARAMHVLDMISKIVNEQPGERVLLQGIPLIGSFVVGDDSVLRSQGHQLQRIKAILGS
jgi:hypothetical protein